MNYVSEASQTLAKMMEQKFAGLPIKAGIIFASVGAKPAPKGECTDFLVVLGFDHSMPVDDSTGQGLVLKVLKEEVEGGKYNFLVQVVRGRTCAGAALSA